MTIYYAVVFLLLLAGLEFLGIRTAYRRTRRHPLATTLQGGLSPLDRGAAVRTSGVQPPPAPVRLLAGAGPTPAGGPSPADERPPAGPQHRATTRPIHARPSSDGGGPALTSADASDPPCLASAGSHPASGPETGAGPVPTSAGDELLCACTGGTVECHGCPRRYAVDAARGTA